MAYFGGPLAQIQAKVKFLIKLGCHVLEVKIM